MEGQQSNPANHGALDSSSGWIWAPPLLRDASPSLSASLDLTRTGIEDSHTGDTLPLPSSIWSPANTRKGPRRRIQVRSTMANLSWLPTRVVGQQPIPTRLSSPTGLLADLLGYPCSTSLSMASTHGGSEPLHPRGATAKEGQDNGGGGARAASGMVGE
jgi:hypothetical protein